MNSKDMLFETYVEIKEELQDLKNHESDGATTNLDLSDEFLTAILKQVDELCDNIKNGDPNVERTIEVSQKLNSAVTCYRVKLLDKTSIKGDDFQDNFKYEVSPAELDSDSEYIPLKKKKKKKKILQKGIAKQEKKQLKVKREFTDGDIEQKIRRSVGRPKKVNPEDIIENDKLFPFIKVTENKGFECSFCNQSYPERRKLFRHFNVSHHSEIKSIADFNTESRPIQVYDCKKKACRKLYGNKRKNEWCIQCIELSQLPKPRKPPKNPPKPHENQLCPECGLSVFNLKRHLSNKHFGEKQICSQCSKELPSLPSLKEHIKKVHEKVPCVECGKLISTGLMKRHIASKHTPNDLKKFKCDVCGKGFAARANFEDHKNIHTGAKPFKCKYCTACFASKGTHAMHERKHLGHRRDYSKKKTMISP